VTCRSCGAQIADKAIVCYRCGTPTEEVTARFARPRRRGRGTLWVLLSILVALVVWAVYFLLLRS
jgi:predicted nucleic acid-binding Zn ribbon protein